MIVRLKIDFISLFMTNMLMKYGPQVLQNRRNAMARAVEYDISHKWSGVNVKRYKELFCKIHVSGNNKVA